MSYRTEIAEYNDPDLLQEITKLKAENRNLERVMDLNNSLIKACQEETDRRELDRFWAANPTLLRLSVGDKLLVTRELFFAMPNFKQAVWDVGAIAQVTNIWIDNPNVGTCINIYREDCSDRKAGNTFTTIDFKLASEGRRAYLAQQGKTT